jgi:hypothetical protein
VRDDELATNGNIFLALSSINLIKVKLLV